MKRVKYIHDGDSNALPAAIIILELNYALKLIWDKYCQFILTY